MPDSSTNYTYLYGKIKALEMSLFDLPKLYSLCESGNQNRFLSDLSDSDYGYLASSDNIALGLETRFTREYLGIRKKMEDIVPLDIIALRKDITNFICHVSGIESDQMFEESVYKKDWWLSEKWPSIFREIKYRYEKLKGPLGSSDVNEALIEMLCMDHINYTMLPEIKSGLIRQYWKDYVDIKNFSRKKSNKDSKYFWPGGHIEKNRWLRMSLAEEWPLKLKSHRILSKLVNTSPVELESECDNLISSQVKKMRKISYGPEVVFSFLISVEAEIKNLKKILNGINLGIKPDEIKRQLNLAYV